MWCDFLHIYSSLFFHLMFQTLSWHESARNQILTIALRAESTNSASVGFGSLDLTVPGRRGGHQGTEQDGGSLNYFVNGPIERFPVRGRWCGKSANLPYELQGRHPDLHVGRRGFEIKQSLDIPTYFVHLTSSNAILISFYKGIGIVHLLSCLCLSSLFIRRMGRLSISRTLIYGYEIL